MALKSCKECGKEVSSKAEKCPNCGAPVKRKGSGCLGAIGLIFLLLIFIVIVFRSPGGGSKSISSNSKMKLEIVKGWQWIDEGDWTYIRGSVKNVGDVPIGYFKVQAEYKNAKGEVVDTDYTNSGERVNPGAAKKFEIMHRDSPEFKNVSISIGRVSRAR